VASRRRVIFEATLLLALAAAFLARARGGVRLDDLGFLFALAGPGYGRLLALRGRVVSRHAALTLLEVAALAGAALARPRPVWADLLLLLANAVLVWDAAWAREEEPFPPLERAPLLGIAVLAVGLTTLLVWSDPYMNVLQLPLLVALLAESAAATGSKRALGAGAALGAIGLTVGKDMCRPPHQASVLLLAAVCALAASRPARIAASPAWRRAAGAAFACLALAAGVLLVAAPFIPPTPVRIPLAPGAGERQDGHRVSLWLEPRRDLVVLEDEVLLEDGAPLPRPDASYADIAALGSGRYVATRFAVTWSSSDGRDPLTGGHAYELTARIPVLFSLPAQALLAALILAGYAAWRGGAIRLGPSPSWLRAALVSLLGASLVTGLAPGWDKVFVATDSESYVRHSTIRTALYPLWIDAFDRSPGEGRLDAVARTPWRARTAPEHRYLGVLRAQKVLVILALAALVLALSGAADAWLLALAVFWLVLRDLSSDGDGTVHFNVGALASEGLNHPLIFLLFAVLLAYLRRPSFGRGLVFALLLALLDLVRPANSILGVLLPFVFIYDGATSGWRRAAPRIGLILLAFAAPLAFASHRHEARTGHFGLHSFTGWNTIGVALQVGEPGDEATFADEPEVERFVRGCLVDHAAWHEEYGVANGPDCLNRNIYNVAGPVFEKTIAVPPGADAATFMNDVFVRVTRRLLLRHPVAYARIVLVNLRAVWNWWRDGIALAVGLVAALAFRRTREPPFLFVAVLACLPLIAIAPACLVSFPLDRYDGQFGFLRDAVAPLLLAVAVGRRSAPRPALKS